MLCRDPVVVRAVAALAADRAAEDLEEAPVGAALVEASAAHAPAALARISTALIFTDVIMALAFMGRIMAVGVWAACSA